MVAFAADASERQAPDLSNLHVLLSQGEYRDLLAWIRREASPSDELRKRFEELGLEIEG